MRLYATTGLLGQGVFDACAARREARSKRRQRQETEAA